MFIFYKRYIHQICIVKLLMEFIRSLNRNEQALVAPAAWIEWNAGVEGEDQGQRAGEWLTMQRRTIMRIGGSWCDRPCKGDWACTSECCASVAGMVLAAQAIVVEKPQKKSPANPPTKGLPLWWWLGFLTLTSDKFIANAEKYEEIRNGRHSSGCFRVFSYKFRLLCGLQLSLLGRCGCKRATKSCKFSRKDML